MSIATLLVTLFSVLIPSKGWYRPDEPINIMVDAGAPVSIFVTQFDGQRVDTDVPTIVDAKKEIDLKTMYPAMRAGTFIVYAVPEGHTLRDFVGTPLVVSLRTDTRPGAPSGAIVVKVEPLVMAKINSDLGSMTAGFYYDVAPNTSANFISLSTGKFYDGLTFHRIIPGFVVQGGDPLGTGAGGPGYEIDAEFSARPHLRGVLSMAREGDPLEPGMPPRSEYANSAGSQFFICLDYKKTQRLDRKYSVFGAVIDGLDVLDKLAGVEIADASSGAPVKAPVITSIEILPVTADNNPYPRLVDQLYQQPEGVGGTTTQPAQ
ncbi:MAG TPA: peptidylprolyl isomerase [Tepidisphaeraceae bacterium]|nr:peptidylprolyl isomerase [Tepidisphaeraceae bacterium]